ncbi:MAG: carC 7 [Aeromicrobium sp.]|nr:carC 7 [Aeromicrobium sp.]
MKRTIFEPEHEAFRRSVRDFIASEITPRHAEWEQAGIVDRTLFVAAGRQGLLGFNVPEEFGGGGTDDFRFNAVVAEELAKAGATGPAFTLHNDVLAPYMTSLTNDEQKARWLPGFASGELIPAVAMSEPGAGSDLAGVRTSAVPDDARGGWVLNGAKTFISSGINADLVVVVTRTDPEAGHKGFTLLVVERDMPGFTRGRNLDKMGLHAQDTAELSFEDVFVPDANVLGEVGRGFYHLMTNLPSERLSIAISGIASARQVFDDTLEYAKNRQAFGQPIGTFQHNRFVLAEMDTELEIAQVYVDRCLAAVVAGELTAVQASKAKWWVTELQLKVINQCLQLHGGYGYMSEYPVSKAYTDARIQTIYGGTTEIMKDIIGRDLGV